MLMSDIKKFKIDFLNACFLPYDSEYSPVIKHP